MDNIEFIMEYRKVPIMKNSDGYWIKYKDKNIGPFNQLEFCIDFIYELK